MSVQSGKIQSVTGLVDPSALGFTHSHEHILWDYFKMIKSYDVIFEDEQVARYEVQRFKDAGGGSLIDCSSGGIGTQPAALRRISEATGVNIVLGCGWYREIVYEDSVFKTTAHNLAQRLIREIADGFSGTDIKAGFIGEIGTERGHITSAEERVFTAAAKASLETGVAIFTHTTHFGDLAIEQIDLLESLGVASDRILISHLGDREDPTGLMKIAKRGVYMSIDNIGYEGDGYPSDNVRMENVLMLLREGYEDRVVLGTDVGSRSALYSYGGRGFTWLLESFVPKLRASGVSEAQIQAITSSNIATALTIR